MSNKRWQTKKDSVLRVDEKPNRKEEAMFVKNIPMRSDKT